MNKKQIIDKIIEDLPTRDMRGEMSSQDWYAFFEEAFDKGYVEALRINDIAGRSELLVCKSCGEVEVMDEDNWCDKCLNEHFYL